MTNLEEVLYPILQPATRLRLRCIGFPIGEQIISSIFTRTLYTGVSVLNLTTLGSLSILLLPRASTLTNGFRLLEQPTTA